MPGFDTIVVGGGVHGASIFYHLAANFGQRVLLIEARQIAAAATGRSTGIIRHHYTNEITVRLALYGSRAFRGFSEAFGQDIAYVNNGLLFLATEGEEDALRRSVEMQRRLGVGVTVIEPEDIRTYHPDLTPDDVPLAAFERDAGYADPYSVTVGYVKAGEARGGTTSLNTRVRDVRAGSDGSLDVVTDHGDHSARNVVLAVGAWARSVGSRLGLDIPVTPLRLSNAILEVPGGYDSRLPTVLDLVHHMYFRPEGGDLLVGDGEGLGDADPDRFDESLPYRFVEDVSEPLVTRMPRCRGATYKKGWRGLDGASPDYHPIVGPMPEVEGLFVCVGMSGHGFKLAPAIGLSVAERIAKGRYETVDLAPFAPDRFEKGRELRSQYSMSILA